MTTYHLTPERLRELLNYDPETGIFIRRTRAANRVHIGDIAGSLDNIDGYRQIMIDGQKFKAHRLAWLYVHGAWPEFHIDHINGVKTDNRITNLRDVTRSTNQQNLRTARSDSTTGVIGVSGVKGYSTFIARIHVNGKNVYLGCFKTADQAGEAYLTAKRMFHPGCTI